MSLEVVPIHRHPEYLHDCCKIINQEWKRSESARMHSLQQSNDNLPTSLILLKDKVVIGHVKLSVIPSIKTACFIESLVIDKSLRGNGFGSMLMRGAEKSCRALGLKTIYLSTKGQEQFYRRLGYTECSPVSIYGNFMSSISSNLFKRNDEKSKEMNQVETNTRSAPPPPPPPPTSPHNTEAKTNRKTYMKKDL